jgi:hypothetical protein
MTPLQLSSRASKQRSGPVGTQASSTRAPVVVAAPPARAGASA